MLKLKIGDNYLITSDKDRYNHMYIKYVMGCVPLHNVTCIGWYKPSQEIIKDLIKGLKENNCSAVYVLSFGEGLGLSDRINLGAFLGSLRTLAPNVVPKVIKCFIKNNKQYKIAEEIYTTLETDKNSLISHLSKLDEYKKYTNRYKAIPSELKVINENIKKMSKEVKICDRVITLEDLKTLNLINKVKLWNDKLVVEIKPLPIYPSEPLGKCFTLESFRSNPYLAKAAEYLYKGCHFGMVGTKIAIRPNFQPEFLETLDHQFDDMFERSNWSNIGYLHFGVGHLCGGEFNDVIAHTGEHGLEYYFICLKQYITTANVRDYAGKKVWWYPIYDDDNNLVYCAGLDILKHDINSDEVKDMSIAEFQDWRLKRGITFRNNYAGNYNSDSPQSYSGIEDSFIRYCKEYKPELYEELLEKGAINNG